MAAPGNFLFGDAPISKVLTLATAGSSVVVQTLRAARRPLPAYATAWEQAFVFRHPGELLFGIGLLYYFRLLERRSGTAAFGGRVLVTSGLACALNLVAAAALRWQPVSGPYGFLFGCFVPFALEVPPLQRFQLLGLRLTDKAFVYLAGLQLLLSAPRRSVPAALFGLLSGTVYHLNISGARRLKLSRWACQLFGQTSSRPVIRQARLGPPTAGLRAQGQHHQPQQHLRHAQRSQQGPRAQASPDAIAQLVAMGFDEARAVQALQQVSNDVNAAIGILV